MSRMVVEDGKKKIYSTSDVLSFKSGVVTICVCVCVAVWARTHETSAFNPLFLLSCDAQKKTHMDFNIPWSLSCHCFHIPASKTKPNTKLLCSFINHKSCSMGCYISTFTQLGLSWCNQSNWGCLLFVPVWKQGSERRKKNMAWWLWSTLNSFSKNSFLQILQRDYVSVYWAQQSKFTQQWATDDDDGVRLHQKWPHESAPRVNPIPKTDMHYHLHLSWSLATIR